jgi:CBS domain-containing protein
MLASAFVTEIMTRPVIRVHPDTKLAEVARLMREHHISGVPVTDDNDRLVGILSEVDVLRCLHKAAGIASPRGILDLVLDSTPRIGPNLLEVCRRRLENSTAADAMTDRVATIDLTTSVREAARLIRLHGVNRLPVIDEEKRVVGIVTRWNLITALSGKEAAPRGRLRPRVPPARSTPAREVVEQRREEKSQRIWGGV